MSDEPVESAPKFEDAQLAVVADRLKEKFAADDGPLADDEVDDVVRQTAEDISKAPVQKFASLITENKARKRLRERRRAK